MLDHAPQLDRSVQRRRAISSWTLIVLYAIVVTTLMCLILANQMPVESPLVETITPSTCLSADCSPTSYNFNAPFFIGLLIALASMLILFIRPWQPLRERSL